MNLIKIVVDNENLEISLKLLYFYIIYVESDKNKFI